MNREKFDNLSKFFEKFPTIGSRQAMRFTNFISIADKQFISDLSDAMKTLRNSIKVCPLCFIQHDEKKSLCSICSSESRDKSKLIIVEKDADILAMEEANINDGLYFNIGGLIPISTENNNLRTTELLKKIDSSPVKIKEIVLAFSIHPDAEHTTQYIKNILNKKFGNLEVKILGKGLSSGSEIEYSDPDTLRNAFNMRI